jgi:DNA-binding NarL/FixJ family response regulator
MVLEDEPLTRFSLVSALTYFEFDVVIEESQPGLALSRAKIAKPDVAVLDLHLGKGATGLDVARELRKANPAIGLVLLTSYDDPRLLNPSLPPVPAGTVYLTKQKIAKLTELRDAVLRCLDRSHIDEPQHIPAFGNLSDVQVETLRLVAQGLSNAEIAKRRFVKEKSIELTISRVAKSLGIEASGTLNQRVHIARVYFRAIGVKVDAEQT